MKTLQDKIKLGNLAKEFNLGAKDAFHVAAVVSWCEVEVSPGDSLKYEVITKEGYEEEEDLVICERNDPARQFIVDPFLLEPVPPYAKFWALPILSSVVNLTHSFQILGRERVVVELPEGMTEDDISCALQRC